MTDIEIAKLYDKKDINEIAKTKNLEIEQYGKYKAKITKSNNNKNGKLILTTAISPTPLGEGKTTMSIALADSMNKIGKDVILALREPSMGPVFGIKGGATGGGLCQVVPMEDINLFFTGDIPAITQANDLICSLIDNHIYQGNELEIDDVVFSRCIDLNDRALRNVDIGRKDNFSITAASEIMAIVCLAQDIKSLKQMLGNILIGYTKDKKEIYLRDLKVEGCIAAVLKDAIKPNLVQTLFNTACIIHRRPFANIAHGCNSIIATKMALQTSDYVITEAGFGSELGAEKFIDIKCRKAGIYPDAIVLVATLKALKYHGGKKDNFFEKDIESLEKGLYNIYHHYEFLSRFNTNVIIAFNHYKDDNEDEIKFLEDELNKKGISYSFVDSYLNGQTGAIDLANKVISLIDDSDNINKDENIHENIDDKNQKVKFLYKLEDDIKTKIQKVAKSAYGAENVSYLDGVLEKIQEIEKNHKDLPICIAKTQYALCGNAKCKTSKEVVVRDIKVKSGAGFVVVYLGNIVTMPALGKTPSALNIDISDNGDITGIF